MAIVGASANPEKRGHQVVAALLASGFGGSIYPINPRGGDLLGLDVIESIEALPETPDLAYIARPAAAVPDAVAACGRRGIRGAIVPAVGFRESDGDGVKLEARLLAAARESGIRVIGPNTSGVLNTHTGLHMVGGEPLPPGGLGILTQSGNIALDLMTAASARPIGVSIYVGPGNETDIGFHEYLEYLGQHEPTRAIAIYVEGVRDGRALFDTVRDVVRQKPVIALKGGRSAAGGRAARLHTGAIAGSYQVFRALARQTGLIEVERSDELLAVAETLANQPPLARPGIAVLSDGGGHATLAADHLSAAGVPLSGLTEATRAGLAELLGPAASVTNPVDAAGAADQAPSVLVQALRLLMADPECGGVLLTGLFGGYHIRFAAGLAADELSAADGIADAAAESGVPLVVHSLYASRLPPPLARLLERGVPVHGSLERAIRCQCALSERASSLAGPGWGHDSPMPPEPAGSAPDTPPTTAGSPPAAPAPEGRWLSELEARDLLEPHGVTLVAATFCADAGEAAEAAVGPGPYALKTVSRHLPHKTEAGAVRLGLEGPDAVRVAFGAAQEASAAYLTERGLPPELEGALVSRMQPVPVAELLIGARRDPQFGPILTLAIGGTAVELHRDLAIRGLPLVATDIEAMCRELRLAPLLLGYRGRPAVDLAAIAAVGLSLGECLLARPDLREIELNPVFAYPDRAVAIDATAYLVKL